MRILRPVDKFEIPLKINVTRKAKSGFFRQLKAKPKLGEAVLKTRTSC